MSEWRDMIRIRQPPPSPSGAAADLRSRALVGRANTMGDIFFDQDEKLAQARVAGIVGGVDPDQEDLLSIERRALSLRPARADETAASSDPFASTVFREESREGTLYEKSSAAVARKSTHDMSRILAAQREEEEAEEEEAKQEKPKARKSRHWSTVSKGLTLSARRGAADSNGGDTEPSSPTIDEEQGISPGSGTKKRGTLVQRIFTVRSLKRKEYQANAAAAAATTSSGAPSTDGSLAGLTGPTPDRVELQLETGTNNPAFGQDDA